MIEATKTGSPQEIAESFRNMSATLDLLPSSLTLKVEVKTEFLRKGE
jgi:hypothetical protein